MKLCCFKNNKIKELDQTRKMSYKIYIEQVAHAKKKYIGKYHTLTRTSRHDYYTYVARALKTLKIAENIYKQNLILMHKTPKDIVFVLSKKNKQYALDMAFALLLGSIAHISIEYCNSLISIQDNDLKLLDSCFNNQLKYIHHKFEQRTYRFTRLKNPMKVSKNIFIII